MSIGHFNTSIAFPRLAETQFATPEVVNFFYDSFTAKSSRDVDAWLEYFHPTNVAYYDATLGIGAPDRASWEQMSAFYVDTWSEGSRSYPLRILGDIDSAIVYYVDSPELFGEEIRVLAAVNFLDGKVTREADYWDGRKNSVIELRASDDEFTYNLGLETVTENADPKMNDLVHQLNAGLSSGNVNSTIPLFSYDAVFEDLTLRARIEGKLAIERYLKRALSQLPYGPGAKVRHVLGSATGGGYEWQPRGGKVLNGISALEVDGGGLIRRFTASWDASQVDDDTMKSLVSLSIE